MSDRAAWVFHRERRAICEGGAIALGGLLRLAAWSAAASQLQQRSAAPAATHAAEEASDEGWAYLPLALLAWLVLCCYGCCCLGPALWLRHQPAPAAKVGITERGGARADNGTAVAGAACCTNQLL